MREQLTAAQQAGQRVWIVCHVPPGGNSYLPSEILWLPQYLVTWNQIIQEFSSVIVMQMSGHTHHDDFRLQYAATPSQQQTQPYGAVLLTPSVSPIYANNPSFRVLRTNAEYDHQAGLPPWSIVDYTQVFMDLWLANTKGITTFVPEYSFQQAYSLPDVTALSLQSLYQSFLKIPGRLAAWLNYLVVLVCSVPDPLPLQPFHNPPACPSPPLKTEVPSQFPNTDNIFDYTCAIMYNENAASEVCVSQELTPDAPPPFPPQ